MLPYNTALKILYTKIYNKITATKLNNKLLLEQEKLVNLFFNSIITLLHIYLWLIIRI